MWRRYRTHTVHYTQKRYRATLRRHWLYKTSRRLNWDPGRRRSGCKQTAYPWIHDYNATIWREHYIQMYTRTKSDKQTIYMYMSNTRCIRENRRKYMMYSTKTTENEGGTDSETSPSVGSGLISIVPSGRGVGSCFTSTGGAGSDSSGTSAR